MQTVELVEGKWLEIGAFSSRSTYSSSIVRWVWSSRWSCRAQLRRWRCAAITFGPLAAAFLEGWRAAPRRIGGPTYTGYVYIYRSGSGNIFKIGKAADVAKRVKAHTTGNPEPLTEFAVIETEDAFRCETYLHHRLRSKRSKRSGATEFFEVDPDELTAVIADARHYVSEVLPTLAEADRLAEKPCDDRVLPPTDHVLQTYRELVKVREEYDTLGFRKEFLEAQLKLVIGTAFGIERVADWRTVVQQRLDGDRLKREEPDVYEAYQRETRFRRFNLL